MRYYILKKDEYIRIHKYHIGKYSYDDLLKINMDNKIIYKISSAFREVSYEDFLDFKYCGYLIMDKREKDNMEEWLEFIKVNKISLRFLTKPFPKFYKINIIEFEELKK